MCEASKCVKGWMVSFLAFLVFASLSGCSGGGGGNGGDPPPAGATLPTVTTAEVSTIGTTTASGGGDVTADGGASVTEKGICWSTTANPTVSDSHTSDGTGTGAFTSAMNGLTQNTTYHVRAFAVNSAGTAYGSDQTFTTANPAVTYTLTMSVSPASTGAVTTSPATGPFASGTTVSLTAIPASGYQFKQWSGTDATSVTANQIVMNGNKTLTAEFEAVAGAQWKDFSANLAGLGGKATLTGMSWASANEGWITSGMTVGSSGEIYHTTDGGLTFTTQTTQYYTNAIHMLNANEGYAGGIQGRVYRTTNGGGTWNVLGSIGGTLLSISFPPGSTTASTGYCSGYTGKIYSITASGVSSMHTGLSSNLHSISFPSTQGWACGGTIIVHYNGSSWITDQAYPSASYNAIFMINNTTGWAVGDNGVIIHTTDGITWNYQTNPDSSNRSLYAIFFLNANEGWAVGYLGVVLHTTNGGATWTIEANAMTSNPLNYVLFTSSTNGYVVGDGTLLKFTDE